MLLSDGKDQLLFDAPFTRANPLHWLNLTRLRSDEKLVKEVIQKHGLENLRGIFVSHHHVDHAVDVGAMAELTGALAYGDENLKRLLPQARLRHRMMKEGTPVKIGGFTVTPFRIDHEAIPLEFLFMGEVPKDFDFFLFDYKEGATWFYLITHGDLRILWNGSTGDALAKLREFGQRLALDLYVLGLGSLSLKEQWERFGGKHPFKHFIPVHFDNFFFPYDAEEFTFLPFSSLKDQLEMIKEKHPETEWTLPELGRAYEI